MVVRRVLKTGALLLAVAVLGLVSHGGTPAAPLWPENPRNSSSFPSPGALPELPDGFHTLSTTMGGVHYHEADAPLAHSLASVVPAVRYRINRILGVSDPRPVEVVLVPKSPAQARRADLPGAPQWAAGYTVPGSGVLFIRVGSLGVYPHRDVASVLAHELGHEELARLAGPRALPRWFEEGTCMVLARPWDLRDSWSLTLAFMFGDPADLLLADDAFPEDEGKARAAYAEAFSYTEWLTRRGDGPEALGRVARDVGRGRPFESAFALQFGLSPRAGVAAWRSSMARWYRVVSWITGSTTLWVGMILLLVLVAMRQRRRRRLVLQRWEDEEGPQEVSSRPIEPR
jgi:hypothetical protein